MTQYIEGQLAQRSEIFTQIFKYSLLFLIYFFFDGVKTILIFVIIFKRMHGEGAGAGSSDDSSQSGKEVIATAGMTLQAIQNLLSSRSTKNKLQASPDETYEYAIDSQHSAVIYQSFVCFAKTCLGKDGFAGLEGLFEKRFKNCHQIKDHLQQVSRQILSNKLMSEHDKAQFICDLKKEEFLTKLLLELQNYFSDSILHELIIIIFKIWEHYLTFKKKLLSKCKVIGLVLCPKVFNFDEYENEENQLKEESNDTVGEQINKLYTDQNKNEIIDAADCIVGQISKQFFFSKDIIKTNLQEFRLQKVLSDDFAFGQFEIFIRKVCRAVFLTAQNQFHHPDFKQESQSIKSQLQKEHEYSDDEDLSNKFSQKKRKM